LELLETRWQLVLDLHLTQVIAFQMAADLNRPMDQMVKVIQERDIMAQPRTQVMEYLMDLVGNS
jgi:hypothetical protein